MKIFTQPFNYIWSKWEKTPRTPIEAINNWHIHFFLNNILWWFALTRMPVNFQMNASYLPLRGGFVEQLHTKETIELPVTHFLVVKQRNLDIGRWINQRFPHGPHLDMT